MARRASKASVRWRKASCRARDLAQFRFPIAEITAVEESSEDRVLIGALAGQMEYWDRPLPVICLMIHLGILDRKSIAQTACGPQ